MESIQHFHGDSHFYAIQWDVYNSQLSVIKLRGGWRTLYLRVCMQTSHQNGDALFASSWRIREPFGCPRLQRATLAFGALNGEVRP
jgi:hypothetical protein